MKKLVALVVLFSMFCSSASAVDRTYRGKWNTVKNLKLNGTMTCVVTYVGKEKWKGHFYGVWQGQKFDYTEYFYGPPDKLKGKATIDGAGYNWTASLTTKRFLAKFDGDRYTGGFDLKIVEPDKSGRRRR